MPVSDPDDDPDDDYDRRRYVPRTAEQEARRIVGRPAKALRATALIACGVYGLGGLGMLVFAVANWHDPRAWNNQPADAMMPVMFGGVGLLGVAMNAVIAFAAAKARDPKATRWGYAAAVLGILTILTCHPCNPFTWCSVGFGIWLMVAMNRAAVVRVRRPESATPSLWDEPGY